MKYRGLIIILGCLGITFIIFILFTSIYTRYQSNKRLDNFKKVDSSLNASLREFELGNNLSDQADSLISFIENQKNEIEQKIKGEDEDHNFMMRENRAKNLRQKLVEFKIYIKKNFNGLTISNIDSVLYTDDYNESDYEKWEEWNFKGMPKMAIITNLTKMQADVLNLEAEILGEMSANKP